MLRHAWVPLLLAAVAAQVWARPFAFRQPVHDLIHEQKAPVVVINVPARMLRAYAEGKLVFQCPAAVGRHQYPGVEENTRTRLGSYRIEAWTTGYSTKEHPIPWTRNQWQGAFGIHTALLGDDALYQHLHGTVGPAELGDWIINRTPPRDRRPDEDERAYRSYLQQLEYGLSHGCVRVSNENITRLRRFCPIGTRVHTIYCLLERFDAA
ncbi:MAG: L,D-transpeptidase, partial [Candidatus Wallbacteria bacterium]|nr:L,D-transpeptidase [Candidatus Wallbacteria bacterium]